MSTFSTNNIVVSNQIQVGGTASFGIIDMQSSKIMNVASGSNPLDAVNYSQLISASHSGPIGPTGPTGASIVGPTGATGSTGPIGPTGPSGGGSASSIIILGTTMSISVSSTASTYTISIDPNYRGQQSITTLGTLTTGTAGAGFHIGPGVTMSLGSDATGDMYYRAATGILTRVAPSTATNGFLKYSSSIPSASTYGLPSSLTSTGAIPYASSTTAMATNNSFKLQASSSSGYILLLGGQQPGILLAGLNGTGTLGWSNTFNQLYLQSGATGTSVCFGGLNITVNISDTAMNITTPTYFSTNYLTDIFTAPTANIHISPGQSAPGGAPLKFSAGTLLSITESGAMESDGAHLYWTDNSGTRHTIV